MSQAGRDTNTSSVGPNVPIEFVTDSGTAMAIANILDVLGGAGVSTSGSGNVITITATGGTTTIETLTGNTGGAIAPTAGNVNVIGAGSITIAGNPGTSTLTAQLTGLTNHDVLVGTGGSTITSVSPSTSGYVLTSNGTLFDPSFQPVTASGAIITLTGNSGGAVSPTSGNINVVGATLYTVTDNPGTSTLTINPRVNAYPVTPFVAGPVGAAGYQTIQAAENAANAAGGGLVVVLPGTYTENLTLFSGCNIQCLTFSDAGGGVTIIGTHTPPTTGGFTFRNLALTGTAAIFSSAAAGTAHLVIGDCIVNITNGYTFNLPNWTGKLESFDVNAAVGTADGYVNNTGGAEVDIFECSVGSGTANPMIVSGFTLGSGANVYCPIHFTSGTTAIFDYSDINAAVTLSGTSTGEFSSTNFATGTVTPITMSSSAAWTITNSTINTSNVATIAGAGAGTLFLGGLTFVNTNAIAGTLTISTAGGTYPAGNMSTAGFVWTSNGTGVCPTFQAVSSSGAITTITGNTGGAESPLAGNFNIVGTGSITVAGSANTETVQLTGLTTHNVLIGAGTATITKVAPSATSGVPLISQGAAADPTFGTAVVAGGGTGAVTLTGILTGNGTSPITANAVTQHGTLIGGAANAASSLGVATNGQLVIGSVGADPVLGNITSSDSSVTITNGAGTISLQVTGGTTSIKTLTGNSGGAISPTAGNINTLGTGSITIAGAGSTLTTQLTGLTNHAVLVGAGTATITNVGPTATAGQVLQSAGLAADPAFSTATYPLTTTINQILYSSSANTVTGLATANQGVLTTGATGIPVITALATNGQLIIGSTAGVPAAATLTPGTGISITNGSNSITIANTGAGFAWVDVTSATQTIAVQTGYVTDHTNVTYTLPATAALGDTFIIVGKLGITTIAQNANQQILMGSASSTVGATGTVAGTNVGDSGTFVCITAGANTIWRSSSFVGNWVVT